MKKMSAAEEVSRGGEAQRLLDNAIYREAMDTVEAKIIEAMKASALGDEKTHNRLVISLQLLRQIEKHIEDVATTGKMAQMQTESNSFVRLRAAAGF